MLTAEVYVSYVGGAGSLESVIVNVTMVIGVRLNFDVYCIQ